MPTFDVWWEPFTRGAGPAGAYVGGLDERRRDALRDRCRALLPVEPFTIEARAWAARGLACPVALRGTRARREFAGGGRLPWRRRCPDPPRPASDMETTWRDRLRYRVDEFFARGTIALILGLFAVSALIIVVIALAVVVSGVGEDHPFLELLYMGLLRTLDPGTMGGDQGSVPFLGAMLVVTLGGLFVISTLIGIINTGIQGRLAELRKGRSRVIESDHTVILGWNQQVFTILSELIGANANQRGRSVVVLADRDKVEMDDEIRARIPDTRGTKIVCRSGSPVDLDEIDIAGIQRSRSVIVLAPEVDEPDIEVIKTILAITNDPEPPTGAVPRRRRDPRPEQPRGGAARRPARGRARRGGRRRFPDHRPDLPPGRPVDRVRRAARLRRRRDLLQPPADPRGTDLRGRVAGVRGLHGDRSLDNGERGAAQSARRDRARGERRADPHRGRRWRDPPVRRRAGAGRSRFDHRVRPDAGHPRVHPAPRLEPQSAADCARARRVRGQGLAIDGRDGRSGRRRAARGAPIRTGQSAAAVRRAVDDEPRGPRRTGHRELRARPRDQPGRSLRRAARRRPNPRHAASPARHRLDHRPPVLDHVGDGGRPESRRWPRSPAPTTSSCRTGSSACS